MKVLACIILLFTFGTLTACGGSSFINEEHRVLCVGEDDGIEEIPFVVGEHQTYNFGNIESKRAWYRPRPEGSSRESIVYENEKYEETKDALCSGDISKEEYEELSDKLMQYSEKDEGPFISTSTDLNPETRTKVIFYESKKISKSLDLNKYNFIVRYTPEIGTNFLIRQAGQSILIGFFGRSEGPVKPFVCGQLKFVKRNLQFGDELNTEISIPSCKKLFKNS